MKMDIRGTVSEKSESNIIQPKIDSQIFGKFTRYIFFESLFFLVIMVWIIFRGVFQFNIKIEYLVTLLPFIGLVIGIRMAVSRLSFSGRGFVTETDVYIFLQCLISLLVYLSLFFIYMIFANYLLGVSVKFLDLILWLLTLLLTSIVFLSLTYTNQILIALEIYYTSGISISLKTKKSTLLIWFFTGISFLMVVISLVIYLYYFGISIWEAIWYTLVSSVALGIIVRNLLKITDYDFIEIKNMIESTEMISYDKIRENSEELSSIMRTVYDIVNDLKIEKISVKSIFAKINSNIDEMNKNLLLIKDSLESVTPIIKNYLKINRELKTNASNLVGYFENLKNLIDNYMSLNKVFQENLNISLESSKSILSEINVVLDNISSANSKVSKVISSIAESLNVFSNISRNITLVGEYLYKVSREFNEIKSLSNRLKNVYISIDMELSKKNLDQSKFKIVSESLRNIADKLDSILAEFLAQGVRKYLDEISIFPIIEEVKSIEEKVKDFYSKSNKIIGTISSVKLRNVDAITSITDKIRNVDMPQEISVLVSSSIQNVSQLEDITNKNIQQFDYLSELITRMLDRINEQIIILSKMKMICKGILEKF